GWIVGVVRGAVSGDRGAGDIRDVWSDGGIVAGVSNGIDQSDAELSAGSICGYGRDSDAIPGEPGDELFRQVDSVYSPDGSDRNWVQCVRGNHCRAEPGAGF